MTIPLWCLFVAMNLPYVWGGWSSYLRKQEFGTIDNKHPRQQQAKLTGAGARAYAAQQNAWEALAIFAPAVLFAHFASPSAALATTLSVVWLASRVLHGVFYVANIDKARSSCFVVALGCALGLVLVGGKVL